MSFYRALFAIFFALLASSCVSETSYYDEFRAGCDADKLDAKMSDKCKAVLEHRIPYDVDGNNTFQAASMGFRDAVTEAYRRVLKYPLAFPRQNRIFGVAPYAIPAVYVDLFRKADSLNKSLINYLFDQVQDIIYDDTQNVPVSAEYLPVLGLDGLFGGQMTLYRSFGYDFWSETPWLGRVSTIVHEARHGDGPFHAYCASRGGWRCDTELLGPYGFSTIYFEMLINGSAVTQPDGSPPLLSKIDVRGLGIAMCLNMRDKILNLPTEIKNLISGKDFSCYSITYDWVMQHEGLPIQP